VGAPAEGLAGHPAGQVDAAVIGGGPAGAAAAALMAQQGLRVRLFERARFPRPHVGESLVPACNRVLLRLGVLDQMDAAGFPRKPGAVWRAHGGRRAYRHGWEGLPEAQLGEAAVRFAERPQPGLAEPHTWHVDRAAFDLLLLDRARALGVEVEEGQAVAAVEPGPAPALRLADGRRVPARVVVDASGRDALLGRQLGLMRKDPNFDQVAVHAWFEGLDLGPAETADHIHVHFLPDRGSWVWQIPIRDGVTSVGLVTQKARLRGDGADPEAWFWAGVAPGGALLDRLRAARRLRPFRVEADYSYAMDQLCGDGWLLVGDAARFVDPIFSSGVSIALNSAAMAADAVVAALHGPGPSAEALAPWALRMRLGAQNWHRFVSAYYRLNVAFTYFVSHPRWRLDVLKLLQGDVWDDPDPAVLGEMESLVREVEAHPEHPLRGALGAPMGQGLGPAPVRA